jgi:AcrR family transcriptional regulator
MIAKRARVNVAMISYYFGGKAGLLKTIIDSFFGLFQPIMLRYSESPLPLDERICAFVHDTVANPRSLSPINGGKGRKAGRGAFLPPFGEGCPKDRKGAASSAPVPFTPQQAARNSFD